MNAPPKIKRHTVKVREDVLSFVTALGIKDGQMLPGLRHPEYAVLFARIITEFEHLEDHMAYFLSVLSGASPVVCGYILRAIKAPRGRADIMASLLTLAARNMDLGDEYDQVIREFGATASARNTYVHGRWWTSSKGRLVVFAPTDEHSHELFNTEQVRRADLDYVLYRIQRTKDLVTSLAGPEAQRGLRQEFPPLKPPPAKPQARQRKLAPARQPPPESSAASPQKKKRPAKKG